MRLEIVLPSLILLALLGASSGTVFTWNGAAYADLTLASSWTCTTGPCTPANYTSEASDIVRINSCASNSLKLTNSNIVNWPTLLLNVSCPTTLNMDDSTSLSVYGVNVQSPLSLLNINISNMFSTSSTYLEVRNTAAPPLQINTFAVSSGTAAIKAYSGINITQLTATPRRVAFRSLRGNIDITNANIITPFTIGFIELGSWSGFTPVMNFWGNVTFSGSSNFTLRFVTQSPSSSVGIAFKPSSSVTVSNPLSFNIPLLRHYIQGAFNINNTDVILGGFSQWTIDSTAFVKGIGAVNNITILQPTELGGQFQKILFYFNTTDLVINTTGTFQACRIKLESTVAAITFDRKVATGPMVISEINIGDAVVTLANGSFSFASVIKGAGRFELVNAQLSIGEVCGNGDCSLTETATNCPQDCSPTCGDRVCAFVVENKQNCYSDCSCGDDVCDDELESCFWCSDCSCSFDGFRVRAYRARARTVDLSLSYVNDTAFSSKTLAFPTAFSTASPVYVVYDSYLQVNVTQHYFFKFEAANVALTFKINGAKILSFPSNPAGQSTAKVVLQKEYIHHLVVELSGYTSAAKTATMSWKREADANFVEFTDSFYSFNIPNDRIWTVATEFDTIDHATFVGDDVCGDGLCLERYPEHCFMDCYTEITTTCSPIAVPPGHISAGLPVRDDTFGNLIRNQMLWHLPGMEHMSYGFNLVHAEQALNPIFYFGYCDEKRLSTVQDTYRGNVYSVPEELFAQPLPKCTFSVDSQTYASSAKMAESYAQDITIEVEASLDANLGLYKGDASVAFSGEKSVKTASELEQKTEGSIVVSEVKCATSRVKLAKHTFHPAFLVDLRKAKTDTDLVNLVKKYGTHVYSSAVLGGKLRQVTTLKKEFQSSKTKQELEESAALSLSASVSGPAFSASGSFSGSIDTSTSTESQASYEKSSFRSNVITYGGPPGSFGPTSSDAPSNFGDWASAIDLLPVPIDYTLQPIYDIIPEQWIMKFDGVDTPARDLWQRADSLHARGFTKRRDGPQSKKYMLWWFWNPINYSTTSAFEVTLWQKGPEMGDPLVLRLRDQSPGAPSGLNFAAANVPKPMPFTFYTDQTTNYMQPTSYFQSSANPSTYIRQNMSGITHLWWNEFGSEYYLHDWSTGVGRYYNNYDGVIEDERVPVLVHKHKLISENIGTYHMNIELAYVSGPNLTQANFEISLVGKNDTLRDALTPWDNGLVRQTGITMTIRFSWKNRPQIGEITEVEMRLSGKTAVIDAPENKSIYTIKNLWLQVPSCDTAVLDQTSCSNTTSWKVFHSLPNRAHEINNFDAEPISIYVKPLESFSKF